MSVAPSFLFLSTRVDKLNILGVTISEDMLASDHVENLVSVCSRSLFALRVLRAHELPDEAMHSVTRAITIARLMYAVPSWWVMTRHCRKRQCQNRTAIQSVKANGVRSRGRP